MQFFVVRAESTLNFGNAEIKKSTDAAHKYFFYCLLFFLYDIFL